MRCAKGVAAALLACAFGTGCFPFGGDRPVIMDVFMAILGGATPKSAPLPRGKTQKVEGQLNVTASVTIGGLDGTYDVTLGPYGQFTGTAQIKGKKGAKLVAEGPELLAAVQGMLLDALESDVTVSEAKAKVSGKQTTGGVNKRYKGKIKFKGTLASGPDAGANVKGKITTSGDLEAVSG
jgi:hypothetical protein